MSIPEINSGYGPEEVGHAYGPARNSVSRMVSEHCAINVDTAVEMRFLPVLPWELKPVGAQYLVHR